MGAGEKKPGFFSSIWMTIILIVVLIVVVAVVVWGFKTGWFDRIGRKKEVKPELKPVMNQQLYNPGECTRLELADNGLIIVRETKLS